MVCGCDGVCSLQQFRKPNASPEPNIRMGISTVPPLQPQDKLPLRVHTLQHTCCRLTPRLDASAASIVREACEKLKLSPADFDLCEVKSSGERVAVRGSDVSLHHGLSVNGRLFLVPKSCTERCLVSVAAPTSAVMPHPLLLPSYSL